MRKRVINAFREIELKALLRAGSVPEVVIIGDEPYLRGRRDPGG